MDDMRLDDDVVLVTGAGRGLGRTGRLTGAGAEVARHLYSDGFSRSRRGQGARTKWLRRHSAIEQIALKQEDKASSNDSVSAARRVTSNSSSASRARILRQ